MDPSEDSVFERLKQKADPSSIRQKEDELSARLQEQHAKAQQRLIAAVNSNSTLPVSVSSVSVLHAPHTRRSFLRQAVQPLLDTGKHGPTPLSDVLREVSSVAGKLQRLDIFNNPISVFLGKPDPTDPSTTPTDVSVFFSAKERSRLTIKTGTEAGHSEGSAYGSVTLRNLFGGAESLNCHGSFGTRTRSAYSAAYEMPLFSNPDFRWEVAGLASSTLKAWASHEEVLKGGVTKLKWGTPNGQLHEFSYNGFWRQVTGLSSNASPTVRADAGDSFKSSLKYMWINDKRDRPLLPQRGYLLKSVAELAGFGPLKGDVSFGKMEVESQAAVPVPMPTSFGYDMVSFTAGLRAGILYPLESTAGSSSEGRGGDRMPLHSLINDRFQLGGPTDIRGFRLAGLGPRDGIDAVGGDVYAAGGASILFPLPRVKRETPLRFQVFVNGGRLLALQDGGASGKDKERFEDSARSNTTAAAVKKAVSSLADGWPSCSAGFGLVYAHPAARFEVNFSLPLALREGEEGRKGLSFGVGINFL